MATALPTKPNQECSICFEGFKTPKILSCGHSFCVACLVRYIGNRVQFPCPVCKHCVQIPQGGVDKFITNFSLQTLVDSLGTEPVGKSCSYFEDSEKNLPRKTNFSRTQASVEPIQYCPNHSQKEIEYYCKTCNSGLCSKCILKDHKDHEYLECDSSRLQTLVVEQLSKSEQAIKNKIEELEKTHGTLLETSEKLKSFCDEACTKISEKTEKIISELKENCEKKQKEIRDNFDMNESQLTETRQKVMTQIKNIKADLDTSCLTTTEEQYLTLIQSLTKLQDLQKLCENMKTDIPPVTYVEWREGRVKVCDILGSTKTKTLYLSSEGISTVNKSESNVFKFNCKDIRWVGVDYFSKEQYTSHGRIWKCRAMKSSGNLYINIESSPEPNSQVGDCDLQYTVRLLQNTNKSGLNPCPYYPSNHYIITARTLSYQTDSSTEAISIDWRRFIDPSQGFIDGHGEFCLRFDVDHVFDVKYRY